jgi:hypothetical protein
MAAPQFDNIPQEYKDRNQWVLWKTMTRAGRPTKVPYRPDDIEADSSDPKTWSSYTQVVEACQRGGYDGIGFVFDVLDPYAGVDLDHCINPDGTIKPKAKAILDKLDTYSEISPSGTGIKVFPKAKNPVKIQKKDGKFQQGFNSKKPDLEIEIYYGNRFFTLTGNRLPDYPSTIEDRNQELTEIFKEVFKDRNYFSGADDGPQRERWSGPVELSPDAAERLQELFAADPTFKAELCTPAPVGKRSDAEFHLCARLWEAGFDEGEIYQIMTSSPQTKWQERGDNYRWETIRNAVAKAEASHREKSKAEEPKPKGEPKLKEVSKDDSEGTIGFDPITGAICKVVEFENDDGSKRKFLGKISDCAVHIHTETRAKDETEFIFIGKGAVDKRDVKFTMKAADAIEGRKFRAALTNAFGAKNRINKLTFPMVQELSLNPRLFQRVEVPTWSGDTPLLPGVGLADNVEYRLSSKIPAAVYDGDLQKAKDAMRTLLKVHKYAPIVLDVVLGAPAIARWHKNDRFGLGLWGMTGTLKTSMALAAMGVYGIGYLDGPKLKAGKGGSTVNGAMEIFAAAGFLPQLYDNVKSVDSKDAENYVSTMHAVLEGEEKARGRKDGGLRESREFLCTPINTGEVRTQEASTTTRIFNLNWTRADGKLLSDVQQNAAQLPVIGYHWLRFLAETDFTLGKDFDAFRAKKFEEFLGLKYVNPGRLATIYTHLVSIWDLLEASPLGDVFIEARESFKAVLEEATAIQGQAATEETEIARFLSGLEELMASNPGLIMSEDGKKTIIGSIIGKRTDKGLFLLPSETLNELQKIKVFNQQPTPDSITQGLHEMGILIRGEKDKLKTRMRIGDNRVYGWHIIWSPAEGTAVPGQKGQENDNKRRSVPGVPVVHDLREKVNSQENLQTFSEDEKTSVQMAGDRGDRGDKEEKRERDRDIDSDFSSSVVSPVVSPAYSKIARETPTKPILSEPKEAIDESVPGKIRVAAMSEYGICGWVNPSKVAAKLHIDVAEVTSWLDAQTNYVRTQSGNGYTQRSKAEA